MENEDGIVNDWQFCTQCGTKNVGDAKFCKSCGYPLTEQEPSISSEQPEVHVEPEQKQESFVNEENNLSMEHSEEVSSPWNGWLLLIPALGWVIYRLAVLAKGDIGLMIGMVFIPNIIAEALGGVVLIIGIPLIITSIIYFTKKTNNLKYIDFVKHTLIASILMLAFAVASNIHAIHDEQKSSSTQALEANVTAPEANTTTSAIPAPVLTEAQQAEKDCDNGQASRCTNLGYLYDNGQGVIQDHFQASGWYKNGCEKGDANGCFELGILYGNGKGLEQDYFQSAIWYQKACDLGSTGACNNLGVQYANGQGVNKDDNEAVKLYTKACKGNDGWGCNNLGNYYYNGTSVDQDYSTALKLFKKSCKNGNADGCKNTEMAKNALGIPVTKVKGTVQEDNLMWQDNKSAKSVVKDWQGAINYCQNLNLGGYTNWRLPNINELRSLVDQNNNPTIKSEFKNAVANTYWSSTQFNFTSEAWFVNFYNNDDGTEDEGLNHYVRCVRNSW